MLEIGSVVGGMYKILNKVGEGGMSVVYLAMNEKANKQWAVKVVRKDGLGDSNIKKQGLITEIEILKKLKHKYLPSIIDVLDTDDSFIIIMDYIEGNSLQKALEEQKVLPQETVIEWAKQLCEVLHYLHTQDKPIIYRDMKPGNVMLRPDNTVALIDFGTAREYKVQNKKDTISLGTVGYAAPEQYSDSGMGQTDARTDIYSLGATIYHLVTGKDPCQPPYDILPIRDINPALSSGLEKIILKCTQRSPEKRYQTAAELLYDLEHYDEIDIQFRKKQVRKLGTFIASCSLSLILAATSLWGYLSAESKKEENYENILGRAATIEEFHNAILTDPSRTEAYTQLNEFVKEDYLLSKDEARGLQELLVGLDEVGSNGFNTTVHVLDELRQVSETAYEEVCFDFGWTILSYYETNTDRDRYASASKWFDLVKDSATENGAIASIFCDIAECTDAINQLNGSKVAQTKQLKEERQHLWQMVQDMMVKVSNYEEDYRLQTWIEIINLINGNTSDFLEVATKDELLNILTEIQENAALSRDNIDVKTLVTKLENSTADAIARVQSAQQ